MTAVIAMSNSAVPFFGIPPVDDDRAGLGCDHVVRVQVTVDDDATRRPARRRDRVQPTMQVSMQYAELGGGEFTGNS
ncbi:hypothetical protein GCM10009745_46710 [Kribbella yunnanensis]|uniref:Uncharacterized protein n=1 Tax=Kribbella yunnanensis TaxID=190194 RepID=A0ABN2HYL5_9ACTN